MPGQIASGKKHYTFTLPEALMDELDSVAAETGRPRQDLLREAVARFVARHHDRRHLPDAVAAILRPASK